MALPRSARVLWAHWRSERRALGQGLVALVLSTAAGFLAGLTLAHLTDRLDRIPGLLVLIPAAVGMRVATPVGLEPDDHSVPILTSVMDISGIAAILLTATVLGLGVR